PRSAARSWSFARSHTVIATSGAPPPGCSLPSIGCVPGLPMSEAERALGALLALMARLRDPQRGCPWDREQTFSSIAPYTIEEAYEVADAIERGEREGLRDELGDLLFQVVFHARMAEERGWFDFAAVATTIHDKLVRRHPHVFAGASPTPQELVRAWEQQKARERAASAGPAPAGEGTVLAGVPRALPALVRAAKLGRRAARVGFDWPDAREVRAKVLEELHEVDGALAAGEAGEGTVVGRAAISMDQAVRMVEQRVHARVVKAEAQKGDGRTVYVLRLLNDSGKVWTVRVDAADGSVQ